MQTGGQRELSILRPKIGRGLVISLLALILSAAFAVLAHQPARAIDTVPAKMNFQGRLTDSSGNIMPDGTYNMKFRIYDAASSGTLQWSEDRAVSASTGVTVTNGLFSVRLGDATPIPADLFDATNLYFEIELPTPATATCSTAACASYSEGPMSPRNPLATSAYSFNSERLDGYDSSDFAFVSGSNTFTSAQSIEVSSTSALSVKNGGGITLLNVDTSSNEVLIGSAANGISFTANGIVFSGSARPSQTVTLSPEYAGATFTGDGTSNIGTLKSDFCSTALAIGSYCYSSTVGMPDEYSFYEWSTSEVTAQDYDVYVRYRLPSDYSAGSMSNLSLAAWTDIVDTTNTVTLTMFEDGNATACASTGNAATIDGEWTEAVVASPLGACSLAANDYVTFRVKLSSIFGNQFVRAGQISFDYRSSF